MAMKTKGCILEVKWKEVGNGFNTGKRGTGHFRDDFLGSGLHNWVFLEPLRAIGNNVCLDGKDGEFSF